VQGRAYIGAAGRTGLPVDFPLDRRDYRAPDIDIVAAFDIARASVRGRSMRRFLAAPNAHAPRDSGCRRSSPVVVKMGPRLDGVPSQMADFPEERASGPRAESQSIHVRPRSRGMARASWGKLLAGRSVPERAVCHYAEDCLSAGVAS